MIGGGGKIGGGPKGPQALGDTAAPKQASEAGGSKTQGAKVSDRFERGALRGPGGGPVPMGAEASASTDVLKMARDNPAGARQLVATMAKQVSTMLTAIASEMAGARTMLEQLAAQKYAKKTRDEKGKELRSKREKVASMKMRKHLGLRKMALLQQIAGKLGDPRLKEEIDRLLRHHEKLNTDWGRRHHLLSIASSLYDHDAQTPEHLRDVVQADVRAGAGGEELGEVFNTASPRRAISELVARTLDGSVRAPGDHLDHALRGAHSQSLHAWAALKEVMGDSLSRDPFAPVADDSDSEGEG